MDLMDTTQKLSQLNNAIAAIECGAQEYRVGNKSVRKADLGTLYNERIRLEQQIRDENSSGGIYVAAFDRR